MRFLTFLVLALLLGGCGVATQRAEPAVEAPPELPPEVRLPEPEPSPRGMEPQDQDPPVEEKPQIVYVDEEPPCSEGQALSVAFVGYDAALGSRFHWARVRNCTDETVTLPEPVLRGRDLGNIWGDMITAPAFGPEPSPLLEPGASALLTLKWLSNGRCARGIQDLRLVLGAESFDSPENCLQLGGSFAPEREADITWTWGDNL
ncbi:hypothetical protein ACX1DX_00345 [Tessaracoccus sp. Y36]